MTEKIVVFGPGTDVHYHLAVETALLERPAGPCRLLYLWQADTALVFGRFQNPYAECDMERIAVSGAALARRISGGGTVYHDSGNLNFSFIEPKATYDEGANLTVVREALADFGIRTSVSSGKALLVNGRKVSGMAFRFSGGMVLHHGTLLVDADLAALQRCLVRPRYRVTDHAVASRRAATANLRDACPGLRVAAVREALARRFLGVFGGAPPGSVDKLVDPDVFADALRRMRSRQWIMGFPASFSVSRSSGGMGCVELAVEDGRLVGGAARETAFFAQFRKVLEYDPVARQGPPRLHAEGGVRG
jgi:lipoate-protein ligase A